MNTGLIIILLIVVADFAWEQYLSYRNRRKMSPEIPAKLTGIYNSEEYARQQAYQKERSRFGFFSESVSFFIILIILLFGLFGWLDGYLRGSVSNEIVLSLLFLGVFFVFNTLITLPFGYYSTFTIEEKYGFNRSTKTIFWIDQLKSLGLTLIIGGILIALVAWFYDGFGQYAWLYVWGVITIISLFMSLFYSNLIVPLFNKQTPLEDGELRDAIKAFATKAGFEIHNIYVIDASKRSSKANAYFTGFGAKKRIVLYDTLINDLTTSEVVAVLAHEIGHYKKKHTIQGMLISIVYTGLMLYLLSFFLGSDWIAKAVGGETASFHLGLIAFSLLFTPVSILLGIFSNMLSRKNEYEADAFAAKYELGQSLISGLKKLSVKSLSNLNPDELNVFIYYSHPTLLQRMAALEKVI